MIALSLSFLGIALSLISVGLTHATFFAPDFWLKFALRRPEQWDRLSFGIEDKIFYRHRQMSGFMISIGDEPLVEDYYEFWLDGPYRADRSAQAHEVRINLNGVPFRSEVFIYFDGFRNFIPQPRRVIDGGLVRFRYDETQRMLARIVGSTHLSHSVDELMDEIMYSSTGATLTNRHRLPNDNLQSLGERLAVAQKRSGM
jgi:hypothetical protein